MRKRIFYLVAILPAIFLFSIYGTTIVTDSLNQVNDDGFSGCPKARG